MNQPPQGFGVGKFQPQARPAFGAPAAAPATAPMAAPMAAPGGFGGGAPPPLAAPGVSPWKGIQSAKPRDPFMCVGDYIVRVISNELGYNPNSREQSFKGHVEILWAAEGSQSRVGEQCVVVHKLNGRNAERNFQRSKAYIMAAAGFDNDAEYDAFDPDGEFCMAVVGTANRYSQAGYGINGRIVRVRVSRGGDVMSKPKTAAEVSAPTGDYYREYAWSPYPEAEQDQTRKPGT